TTRPPDPPTPDPRRFPTLRQRAFVVARDRTCRGPGCRAPAARCEIDHRTDHADGGRTEPDNLDALCPSCHRLKHGGRVARRNPSDDPSWRTLLGRRSHVPATPITPPQRRSVLEERLLKVARRRT